MQAAAFSYLWLLWRQHRWGILFILGGWLLAAALTMAMPRLYPDEFAGSYFMFIMIAMATLVVFHLLMFTYGFDARDIMGGESCFPTSLLRLPARTSTLVFWPITVGAVTAYAIWFVSTDWILRPWTQLIWQADVPLWWPSMMAVAILAWLQALVWAPFGLPWLRVIALLILVQAMVVVPILGKYYEVSEGWRVAWFAGLAAIGWGLAYVGVRHARCGDTPNWQWLTSAPGRMFGTALVPTPSASADHAQNWFEWRVAGLAFPIMAGLLAPVAFVPLFIDLDLSSPLIGSLMCS